MNIRMAIATAALAAVSVTPGCSGSDLETRKCDIRVPVDLGRDQASHFLVSRSDPGPARSDPGPAGPAISADALLDDVLLRFPREPLDIHGEMIVRKRRGVELSRVAFNMVVDWGADPAQFRYRVLDDEGTVQRELVLQLHPGGCPEISGGQGESVDLDSAIESTDLTWADLSLSFLWWRGGRIVGTDTAKGRDCYLVDVPAPAWGADSTGYSRVRLWVDQSLHMLLRADAFDANDKHVRRLWVRSLKKMEGRWMIKDMEVQSYPPVQRTRLRIHSAKAVP